MATFWSLRGIITMISDFSTTAGEATGCTKLMTVRNIDGNIANFIVTPNTYFVDHTTMHVGDMVTGFYDATAPVPAIYPPQILAVIMSKNSTHQNVKVDYFDEQLVSSDGTLKLNLSKFTPILLENDQLFTKSPANHNLIVVYGPTTRSIPAQTTPYKIIVLCPQI